MPTLVKTVRTPPKEWSLHRARASAKWMIPFIAGEWVCEWVAYWLSGWAFLEVLEYVERLGILVAIIFYFADGANRAKQKHYQAWQVINTAQGKGGSGGRVEALQELLEDKVSLVGLDVSDAYLYRVRLERARLERSNFHGVDARGGSFARAKMQFADFTAANVRSGNFAKADFKNADLKDADLREADLTEADLREADLSRVDLRDTNLREVKWKDIRGIKLANVYGVRNAPDGFIDWALSQGAVAIETDRDWYAKLNAERDEQ
ncbi:MAG TPA: pentapeptide repeat-containing protein [Chthoniobacterales bacterium]|nr:pentapeptide repeat-containing protein [Chthoniobacterales bacterium]